MSNARGFRRHLQQTSGRNTYKPRELSLNEVSELIEAWEDLTNEVVAALMRCSHTDAEHLINTRQHELASTYGGMSSLIGPVSTATTLAGHVLHHAGRLEGIDELIASMSNLEHQGRMEAAMALAQAILADAAGMDTVAMDAAGVLLDEAGEDAGPIATGVWMAFCQIGADHGVGATWCAQPDDEEYETSEESDDVDDARDAVGVVAGLVGSVGSGQDEVAEALANTIASDILLMPGVMACFELLALDATPDVATVRRVCHEASERYFEDESDEEEDAKRLVWLAQKLVQQNGWGNDAGERVLAVLRERLSQDG